MKKNKLRIISLKEYLDEEGIRYSVFAKKIGVSINTITKMLRDGYDPSISMVEKIKELTHNKVSYPYWIKCVHQESIKKNQDSIE